MPSRDLPQPNISNLPAHSLRCAAALKPASYSYEGETISSPSCEGPGASGRLALLPFGIVVAPSPTICWCLAQDWRFSRSPEFTRLFDAACAAKRLIVKRNFDVLRDIRKTDRHGRVSFRDVVDQT